MWNDTDIPLAYLITFRSYGTWVHGDERGSIDRFNNRYQTPYIPENKNWSKYNVGKLKSQPVRLNAEQRKTVELAIRETCEKRNWLLRAVNVRTNHAHTVATANKKPDIVLNALKANATRKLRENRLWQPDHSPWADKGSKRRLWTEKSIEIAIEYVLNGQGGELPDFD
jgi:REP element-mobilizing transposase RayT